MTYQEFQFSVNAINHVCSGVICKHSADGTALLVKHDVRFGPGYKRVETMTELYSLIPEIKGYPGCPDPLP